jgi:hypothetical protein
LGFQTGRMRRLQTGIEPAGGECSAGNALACPPARACYQFRANSPLGRVGPGGQACGGVERWLVESEGLSGERRARCHM